MQADRQNSEHRRLIAYNDGVGFVTSGEFRGRGDIRELVEPYRHSDVESLYWGVIGTATTFPVTKGRMIAGHDGAAMGVQGHESFETLNRHGINTLTTAMEYAQGMGLKFHVYQRMGAWAMPFPHDSPTNALCVEHPEWRCVSRTGVATSSLSYAFGEVRRHQVEFLAELASWGADGIDLNFLRGPPFVGYEEPLVSGFQQEYGEDPRTLDEWDGRWLRYRCRSLTAFVRELRAELDAVGRKSGRRISLSADTFALPAGNLYYGLDVAAWVAEGLVDRLHPWGKIRGQPPVDMAHYRGLVDGSRTELWPHLRVWDDGTDAAYDAYRHGSPVALRRGRRGPGRLGRLQPRRQEREGTAPAPARARRRAARGARRPAAQGAGAQDDRHARARGPGRGLHPGNPPGADHAGRLPQAPVHVARLTPAARRHAALDRRGAPWNDLRMVNAIALNVESYEPPLRAPADRPPDPGHAH